jgi:AraC-like DNA-binding protein
LRTPTNGLDQNGHIRLNPGRFAGEQIGEFMLARDAGSYRERQVRGQLQDHFSCVWVNRLRATAPSSIVVVPDGSMDLQWFSGRWRIAGPDRQPQNEPVCGGAVVVGFRFQPGSATGWLGMAASELCNRRVDLQDISASAADQMNMAAETIGSDATISELEAVVAGWAAKVRLPDPEMTVAHRLLSGGAPPGTDVVPWLMAELSMSERTLRRRFETAFGYGPKTLDRILRFQRYLDLSRHRPGESAAHRAAAVGYADQSHLVRECRRLALCTPSQIG